MDKLRNKRKNILIALCLVIILLLLLMAVHSVKACQIVLSQSVQAIDAAGIVLQTAESEDMNQEEYEKLLTQYATMAVNPVQAINGVSENLLLFKRYKLEHFENFILSGVALPNEDMEQMKVIKQIQENAEKAEAAMSNMNNGWLTLLFGGKSSLAHYFEEIESICEKWEKEYI